MLRTYRDAVGILHVQYPTPQRFNWASWNAAHKGDGAGKEAGKGSFAFGKTVGKEAAPATGILGPQHVIAAPYGDKGAALHEAHKLPNGSIGAGKPIGVIAPEVGDKFGTLHLNSGVTSHGLHTMQQAADALISKHNEVRAGHDAEKESMDSKAKAAVQTLSKHPMFAKSVKISGLGDRIKQVAQAHSEWNAAHPGYEIEVQMTEDSKQFNWATWDAKDGRAPEGERKTADSAGGKIDSVLHPSGLKAVAAKGAGVHPDHVKAVLSHVRKGETINLTMKGGSPFSGKAVNSYSPTGTVARSAHSVELQASGKGGGTHIAGPGEHQYGSIEVVKPGQVTHSGTDLSKAHAADVAAASKTRADKAGENLRNLLQKHGEPTGGALRTYTDSEGIMHVQSPLPKTFSWGDWDEKNKSAHGQAGGHLGKLKAGDKVVVQKSAQLTPDEKGEPGSPTKPWPAGKSIAGAQIAGQTVTVSRGTSSSHPDANILVDHPSMKGIQIGQQHVRPVQADKS